MTEAAGLDTALEKAEEWASPWQPGSAARLGVSAGCTGQGVAGGVQFLAVWGKVPSHSLCVLGVWVGGRVAHQSLEAPSYLICTRDGSNVRKSFSKNF